MRRVISAVAAGVGGLLVGIAVTLVAALAVGHLTGTRVLTVLSGSMSPAIATGDAIVVTEMRPAELRIGDVVTFRDPTNRRRLITHRLRALRTDGRHAHAVTKGDANTATERWTVPVDGRVGVVRRAVPRVGYAIGWTSSLTGRVVLIVIPAVLLCVVELRRIWRRPAFAYTQLRLFE